MSAVSSLSQDVGKKSACEALTVARATFYRHMGTSVPFQEEKSRSVSVLALTEQERQTVIEVLHSELF